MTRDELFAGLLWALIVWAGISALTRPIVGALVAVLAFASYAVGLAVGRDE